MVKVYELVVGVVGGFGKMVCSLVEGDTLDRSSQEGDLGMKVVEIDDIESFRRVVAVHVHRVYRWGPC